MRHPRRTHKKEPHDKPRRYVALRRKVAKAPLENRETLIHKLLMQNFLGE